MIDGKRADVLSLPTSIQQDILNRRYSADEINSAYARAISKEKINPPNKINK